MWTAADVIFTAQIYKCKCCVAIYTNMAMCEKDM